MRLRFPTRTDVRRFPIGMLGETASRLEFKQLQEALRRSKQQPKAKISDLFFGSSECVLGAK